MDEKQNEPRDRLISIYYNNGNINALYKFMVDEYKLKYLAIHWSIYDDVLYSPLIYDGRYIKGDNYALGKKYKQWNAESAIVLYDGSFPDEKNILFIINAFITKIVGEDLLKRQKLRQENTINNFYNVMRGGLSSILNTTNLIMLSNDLVKCKRSPSPKISPKSDSPRKKFEYAKPEYAKPEYAKPEYAKPEYAKPEYAKPEYKIDDQTELASLNVEHLNTLNKTTVKLSNSLMDIIDAGYLELDKIKIVNEVFSVRNTVNNISKIIKEVKKTDVTFHVEDDVPEYLYGDVKRVKQLLISFISRFEGDILLYIRGCMISSDEEYAPTLKRKVTPSNILGYKYNVVFEVVGKTLPNVTEYSKPSEVAKKDIDMRICYLLVKKFEGTMNNNCISIMLYEEEPIITDSTTLKMLKGKVIVLIDYKRSDELATFADNHGMRMIFCNTLKEFNLIYDEKPHLFIVRDIATFEDIKDAPKYLVHSKLTNGNITIDLTDEDDIRQKILKILI